MQNAPPSQANDSKWMIVMSLRKCSEANETYSDHLLPTGMHPIGRQKVQCQHGAAEGVHGMLERTQKRSCQCHVVREGSYEGCRCRKDAPLWFSWKSMMTEAVM